MGKLSEYTIIRSYKATQITEYIHPVGLYSHIIHTHTKMLGLYISLAETPK